MTPVTWTPKLRALVITAAVVVLLDQLTKLWIVYNVQPFDPLVLIPGFLKLTHARNPGMMLGLLQQVPVAVFVGFALVALGLLFHFFRQVADHDRLSATALGLVIGGALGNLADRITRGAVVDFLQFDLGWFIWPDFNVADSAIVIGCALLVLDLAAAEAEGRATADSGAESGSTTEAKPGREPGP